MKNAMFILLIICLFLSACANPPTKEIYQSHCKYLGATTDGPYYIYEYRCDNQICLINAHGIFCYREEK